MGHLIYWQVKHAWKVWLSSCLLFIVIGFFISLCLTGLFAIWQRSGEGLETVAPLFLMPLVFGGITLLLVVGNVIRLVIQTFWQEYRLWQILGTSPRQLALLVGGQLALVGGIGGIAGYGISLLFTPRIYQWLQQLVGTTLMPMVPLGFSLLTCLISVGLVFLLGGVGGYWHTSRLFFKVEKDLAAFIVSQSHSLTRGRILLATCLGTALAMCYTAILVGITPSEAVAKGVLELELCLLTLILLIIFLRLIAYQLLPCIIKIWTIVLPRKKSAISSTAYWSVLSRANYLIAVIFPTVTASLLVSTLGMLISNVINQSNTWNEGSRTTENLLIFILYLGTPLILILTNVLVISLASSQEPVRQMRQLRLLGFTSGKLAVEQLVEVLIYVGTFFITALLGNVLLFFAVIEVAIGLNPYLVIVWHDVYLWPSLIALVLGIFLSVVHLGRLVLTRR